MKGKEIKGNKTKIIQQHIVRFLKYLNDCKIIILSGLSYSLQPELASGWDFFGIGIFYFGLDRKIPKSRGSGFETPEGKIPNIPKSPASGLIFSGYPADISKR